MSTAPALSTGSSSQKPALTKNQRKKLKKKLKKALHQNTTAVAPEDSSDVTLNSTTEHAQKDNIDAIKGLGSKLGEKLVLKDDGEALEFFVTPENGLVDTMDTSGVTSSALSTRDQLTVVERERSEVSSVSDGSPAEGGGVYEEEGGAEEEEGEEGEVDVSKWGPLKVPVTVKIADLGNACWVVS